MSATNAPLDVSAGAYVVLKPVLNSAGQVRSMRIDRVMQTLPQHLGNGERAFYLNVTVPKSVFHPLPSVTVSVPEYQMVPPEVSIG